MKSSIPSSNAGLYIHVPFCVKKCAYCGFYSVPRPGGVRAYLAALGREMALYAGVFPAMDTLYLGGGTPSLLSPGQVAGVLEAAEYALPLLPEAHKSLEANPGTVTAESLRGYRELGFDRINLGVQSFDDAALSFLGRSHTAQEAEEAFSLCREAGFAEVGLDLVYGLPGQTAGRWKQDLDRALELSPEHLSCYLLSLEPGTPLFVRAEKGLFSPSPEGVAAGLFLFTSVYLEKRGYLHYEISNFARGGEYVSPHNAKYWSRAPYLGLGPSAHSFLGGRRWWNARDVDDYVDRLGRGEAPVAGAEDLTPAQEEMEWVFLGLRTRRGLDAAEYARRFGGDFATPYGAAMERLAGLGYMSREGERFFPTRKGMLKADGMAKNLWEAGQAVQGRE
ncbi:MAG: radical SAM family heme chaperone HemW [Deltaproteobacteria bacterium]|nr:radical SAM family heme chaperone HemW [Deltaproteobacteria bacterium]